MFLAEGSVFTPFLFLSKIKNPASKEAGRYFIMFYHSWRHERLQWICAFVEKKSIRKRSKSKDLNNVIFLRG